MRLNMSIDTDQQHQKAASPHGVVARSSSRYANGRSGFALRRPAVRPHGGSCQGFLAVRAEMHPAVSTLALHRQLIEAAVPSGGIASRAAARVADAVQALGGQSMNADRYAPSRVGAAFRAEA